MCVSKACGILRIEGQDFWSTGMHSGREQAKLLDHDPSLLMVQREVLVLSKEQGRIHKRESRLIEFSNDSARVS